MCSIHICQTEDNFRIKPKKEFLGMVQEQMLLTDVSHLTHLQMKLVVRN